MKFTRITAIVLVFALCLCGCSKKNKEEESTENESLLASFFNGGAGQEQSSISGVLSAFGNQHNGDSSGAVPTSSQTSVESTTTVADVVHSITGAPSSGASLYESPTTVWDKNKPHIYNGGDFVFYYMLATNSEEVEYNVGFTLNGVYQNIKLEYDGVTTDYAPMHKVKISDSTNGSLFLKVSMRPNIGKAGDVLQFCYATIENPSAKDTTPNSDGSSIQMGFIANTALDLIMNKDSDMSASICDNFSGLQVNEYNKDIKELFRTGNDTGEICKSFIYKDLSSQISWENFVFGNINSHNIMTTNRIRAEKTENFPFTVTLGGGKEGTMQRVSMYINSEPIPVFDGKYYADVPIEKNKQRI